MDFTLKPLSPEAVPRALAKAERYRLLNEPGEAESICLDALEADPENQEALVTMVLALTDQFDEDATHALAVGNVGLIMSYGYAYVPPPTPTSRPRLRPRSSRPGPTYRS